MKKNQDPIDQYFTLAKYFIIVLMIWLLVIILSLVGMVRNINDDSEAIDQLQRRIFQEQEMDQEKIDSIIRSGNFLMPISSVIYEKGKVNAIITGYSSTPDQTDSTPFITASGERVREGIVACPSYCDFGDIIEIEDMGLFECQDVMNERYRDDHYYDIWFESRWLALKFGRQEREVIRY